MNLLDTNILIRYLIEDDKEKTDQCQKLLEQAIKAEVDLYITDVAIAEIIWVLESFYNLNRSKIKEWIEMILTTCNLKFQNKEILEESIILYEKYKIDFIDAYHSAFMKRKKFTSIYSYDTDFDRILEIRRIEP